MTIDTRTPLTVENTQMSPLIYDLVTTKTWREGVRRKLPYHNPRTLTGTTLKYGTFSRSLYLVLK